MVAYVLAGIFVCTICTCFYCCVKSCCCKNDSSKVGIENKELTASGYAMNKKNMGAGGKGDMELASMNSSDEDIDARTNDGGRSKGQGPQVKKESK